MYKKLVVLVFLFASFALAERVLAERMGRAGPYPTSLEIAFAPSTVDIGKTPSGTVTIIATLTPGAPGKTIQIYYSDGSKGGPWTLITEGSTNKESKVSVVWTPPHTGIFYFRAIFLGDNQRASSETIDSLSLNVVPEFSLSTTQLLSAILLISVAMAFRKQQLHRKHP